MMRISNELAAYIPSRLFKLGADMLARNPNFWSFGQVEEVRLSAILVFLSMMLSLAGCGGTHHHFVYAVGRNSEGIFAFEEAAGGALTQVSGSPFSTGSIPTAIAVTPSRAFAYVLSSGGNGILTYTFDKSKGGLVAAAGAIATGSAPISIAIDPSSQHVYVLNQSSSNVSAYAIDATTGALSSISGSPFATVAGPVSMALSNKGDALYVVSPTQGITSFSVKADGSLTAGQAPIPAGTAPTFVTVAPGDRFVYVADGSGNSVIGFSSSGSALTPLNNSVSTGTMPIGLAIDPQGKFLFAANQGSNNVSAFAIGSSGTLTAISNSPFSTGTAPTFLTVNHSGDHLYVADRDSNDLADFSLSGSGSLAPVSGSPISLGISPVWIAVTD